MKLQWKEVVPDPEPFFQANARWAIYRVFDNGARWGAFVSRDLDNAPMWESLGEASSFDAAKTLCEADAADQGGEIHAP